MNLLLSDPAFLSVAAAVSGGGGYDADAQAYITAVETADGLALETAVKDAINAFVVGCKADAIWSAIKASCILAGARTLNGALVPLAGTAPTNFNFVAGDYNRKTGLVGDGSTKYLDSNRNNNADPQNSSHVSVYASSAPTSTGTQYPTYVFAGTSESSCTGIGRLNSNGQLFVRNRSSVIQSIGSGSAVGFIGVNRNSSSQFTGRVSQSNTLYTLASSPPVSFNYGVYRSISLSSVNDNSTFSNARLAFYSIGESLDLALLDARVTTLINAFAAAIP